MVVLYDMLLGKGIQCGGLIKRFLSNHKVELMTAFRDSAERSSIMESSGTLIYVSCFTACTENPYSGTCLSGYLNQPATACIAWPPV